MNRVDRRAWVRKNTVKRRRDGTTATKTPIFLRRALNRRRAQLAKVSRRAGR